MNRISDWHLFLWAALYSSKFSWCYIRSPLALEVMRERLNGGVAFYFKLVIRRPSVYVPYSLQSDYEQFHGLKPLYDELPF